MFLPVALLLVSATLSADETDRICSQAVELHQKGDLGAAINSYKACLAAKPELTMMWSNYGAALAQAGRYEDAIEVYRKALKGAPDPRLRRNLALAYYKSGALDAAIAEIQTLRVATPDDVSLTFLLADCHLRLGQFQKVIELLTPLEAAGRESKAVAYLLGMALLRSGDLERSKAYLERIQKGGDTAEARFVDAMVKFMGGDYPAAVQGFAKAIELNPDVPSLQSYYGQALLLTGDPDGAALAFRKELARDPNEFESNLKLGSILQFRKQLTEALPYLEQARRLRPPSLEAQNAVAKTYLALNRWEEARAAYERLLAAAPQFGEARGALADVYDRLGRQTDAARERAAAARADKPATADTGLLAAGSAAPPFTLLPASLAELHKGRPAVLVFGSYTCPKYRFDAATLNTLAAKYQNKANFLLIYVQEAHSEADWQSSQNQREGVNLRPARTFEEKTQHASLCTRKLQVKFLSVVDGMDRVVESAYHGWPSAIYIVGTDGHIAWRSRLGEQEFSSVDFEANLRQALP
ncbi:MAG: tetratricopeptide repeat protein [Bryobacteraceae bacterium]